jgi:hypothetical protein
MNKQQSKNFQNLKYFEMDASFKRVNASINNNTIKEWEITSYVENFNKSKYYYIIYILYYIIMIFYKLL